LADVDCIVIGAGVVGLACARALAQQGRDVLLLERHGHIGEETSSRNSEVIHAGIYYPTGSAKARLCVRGKELLYEYCAAHSIPHNNCGKLIVATDESQLTVLEGYQQQARRNGVGELTSLSQAQIVELEPEVDAVAGLWSPTTGIVDSHAFMLSLQGQLEQAGGVIAFATPVTALEQKNSQLIVHSDDYSVSCSTLINSAGHGAPQLAAALSADVPSGYYARGHYYGYRGRPPFSRLVYPVAEAGGLGVHVTVDLAGQVKFGPDVEWVQALDYRFDDSRRQRFAAAIRRYFPALDADRLEPGYVGIRPKISAPGEAAADFQIAGETDHGVPGLINLLGIESPGLTSALAIAEEVAGRC
jgi:L-2-hydroxyglutarate oxidase LhgO